MTLSALGFTVSPCKQHRREVRAASEMTTLARCYLVVEAVSAAALKPPSSTFTACLTADCTLSYRALDASMTDQHSVMI